MRSKILIKGIVQGVGFRPFLYRSAQQYKLTGYVKNTSQGVIMEVEGEKQNIEDFSRHIESNPPPLSLIESYEIFEIPPLLSKTFEIIPSEDTGKGDLLVSPDIAI
ncbi:MAG: carbamoyltransferase HypF, partial [bacterium]|nr:carbamoyltransferase HypF [bacterium]